MRQRTDELAVLAAHCSPMHTFQATQAGTLLDIDLNVMQRASPDDSAFAPYVPDQLDRRNRLFLLGDILTTAGTSEAVPGDIGAIKREQAEALLPA